MRDLRKTLLTGIAAVTFGAGSGLASAQEHVAKRGALLNKGPKRGAPVSAVHHKT
jgi:hypothetical protein